MTKRSALDDVPRELARRVRRYARATGKTPNAALESLLNDSLAWWEADAATRPEDPEPEPWPEDVGAQVDWFLGQVANSNIGCRASGSTCLISHPSVEIFGLDWVATLLIARDEIQVVTSEDGRPVWFTLTTKGQVHLDALRNIATKEEGITDD